MKDARFHHLVALALALLVVAPSSASAEDAPLWKPEYTEFRDWEYIATGTLLGVAITTELIWSELEDPNWVGPILVDDIVREIIRPESLEGMTLADQISDVLVLSTAFYPFVDAVWAGGFINREPRVTGQMLLMNIEALAVTGMTVGIAKRLIGRRRPGYGICYDNPDLPACQSRSTKSHPSGHSAMAFTGAGLACVHHANLALYGGGTADKVACYAAIAAATSTALLRISANAHYLSDVVVGGMIGAASGYLVPHFLHYSGGESAPSGAALEMQQAISAPVFTYSTTF